MRLSLSPFIVLTFGITAGACMDATIKYLEHTNHVLLVTLGRYLFGAVFAFGIWSHHGRPRITTEMVRAHALRGVVVAFCGVTFFWSLKVLPLAEAVTISFFYPLLAPFVARLMLGERVRTASVISALIGFAGVIIAVQGTPASELTPLHWWGVGAAIAATFAFAIAMVMLRDRAQRDGPAIVGVMSSLMPGLIILPPAIVFSAPPHISELPLFLMMGVFAAALTYVTARAYAHAEAQRLAPIHYTELLWATLLGFLVFHETPRLQLFLGAALIIAACLFTAYEQRRGAPILSEQA